MLDLTCFWLYNRCIGTAVGKYTFDKGSFFVVNSLRIVAGFFGLAPKVAQTPIERCLTHAAHSKNSFK